MRTAKGARQARGLLERGRGERKTNSRNACDPLADQGVPIGIKDLVETKGIKTTSGSIIYKDYIPTEDDVVVERLKNAGAISLARFRPWCWDRAVRDPSSLSDHRVR